MYNVTGDHKDSMRINLYGTTLTGLTTTWYADKVEAWNQRTRRWYFEDLYVACIKDLYMKLLNRTQ